MALYIIVLYFPWYHNEETSVYDQHVQQWNNVDLAICPKQVLVDDLPRSQSIVLIKDSRNFIWVDSNESVIKEKVTKPLQ